MLLWVLAWVRGREKYQGVNGCRPFFPLSEKRGNSSPGVGLPMVHVKLAMCGGYFEAESPQVDKCLLHFVQLPSPTTSSPTT